MALKYLVNQVNNEGGDCSWKQRTDLFFPEYDLLAIPGVRRRLNVKSFSDDELEAASKAYDELESQFLEEDRSYVQKCRARKTLPKSLNVGDHFPVKLWLQGKWKPPQEKVKRKKRNRRDWDNVGDCTSDTGCVSQTKNRDLLIRSDYKRVDLDSLEDKYILLYFVFLPTMVSYEGDSLRLFELCSELCAKRKAEFEIVLLVQMRKDWEENEQAFSKFVHFFPNNCLSVPFELSADRKRLFESVSFDFFPNAILVDPKSKVVNPEFCGDYFDYYGSVRYYPFTESVVKSADKKDFKLLNMLTSGLGFAQRLLPPHKLLSHTRRDFELVNSLDTGKKKNLSTLILELKAADKPLFLYLCHNGLWLQWLPVVRKWCDNIVLVHSFSEFGLLEFRDIVSSALVDNGISCWILPFDNSASHRLFRLCDRPLDDMMICVEPSGRYADPYAADVFKTFGGDAYPFTRGHLIIKEYKRLRKVTINSLLFSGFQDYVFDANNNPVRASRLRNSYVLVYFEDLERASTYRGRAGDELLYGTSEEVVEEWHEKLLARFPSLQVIFVCYSEAGCDVSMESSGKKKWLVCHFNRDFLTSLTSQVSVMGEFPQPGGCLMSFGRDGKLCSFLARTLLECGREDLFDDHLREDIFSLLVENCEFMESLDPGFDIGC